MKIEIQNHKMSVVDAEPQKGPALTAEFIKENNRIVCNNLIVTSTDHTSRELQHKMRWLKYLAKKLLLLVTLLVISILPTFAQKPIDIKKLIDFVSISDTNSCVIYGIRYDNQLYWTNQSTFDNLFDCYRYYEELSFYKSHKKRKFARMIKNTFNIVGDTCYQIKELEAI